MKEDVWVKSAEMPDPKIEKASDVIVKIGAAGVCRTDLHIMKVSGVIFRTRMINYCHVSWDTRMLVG
ncbi:MAG: hypothetical protein CM1200mP5_5180 [Candidatus Pelagibacterales bacterium]|nr:MAG: hypothetical protein CM1200mP5_5180 [Pelagibacterales bacterium]